MENRLEKFSSDQSGQKEKEQDEKEAKRRRDDILDKIQHYVDFLNETETAKKLMSKYGFEYSEAENIVEKNLISLAEDVNSLVADKEVHLADNNSLADIIGNSVMGDLGLIMRQIKNVKQTVKQGSVEGKISIEEYKTRNEKSLDKLKKFLEGLESSLNKISYYVKTICGDEEKLKMELTRKNGYLENFKNYFYSKKKYSYDKKGDVIGDEIIEEEITSEKTYPTGVKKIAYFRFFNKWDDRQEWENMTRKDLEEELEKLDGNFMDKDKIRSDFEAKRF